MQAPQSPLLHATLAFHPPPIEEPTVGKWTVWTNVSPDDYQDYDGVMRQLGKGKATKSARYDAEDGTIWYDRKFWRVFIIKGFELQYDFGHREWGHPVPKDLKVPPNQPHPLWLYASERPAAGYQNRIWAQVEPKAPSLPASVAKTSPAWVASKPITWGASESPVWGASNFPGWDVYDPPAIATVNQTLPDQCLDYADPMLVNQFMPHDLEPLTLDANSTPDKGKGKAPVPPGQDEDVVMIEEIERCSEHLTLGERIFQVIPAQMTPFERMAEGIDVGPSSS